MLLWRDIEICWWFLWFFLPIPHMFFGLFLLLNEKQRAKIVNVEITLWCECENKS